MSLKGAERDLEEILLTDEQIENKINELADNLNSYYKDEEVLAICILKGSVPFYWWFQAMVQALPAREMLKF